MKVQVEKKPESISTLKIELPAEEVSKEWDTIANSFARFAKIPGYRPGKAPRAVVDKRFRKEIQGGVADEPGRGPFRRRQINAVSGHGRDRAGIQTAEL